MPAKGEGIKTPPLVRQPNHGLQKMQFNTVASACMKILNALERLPEEDSAADEEGMSILLRLLSPITPHLCHHLWRELKFGDHVMTAPRPEVDPKALEQDGVELVGQGKGKLRGPNPARIQ